jgi:hypothetical protein
MATGGVFQLITNDGKQDRMLMATALLNNRLNLAEQARANDPMISDPTPTLLDIEKTHILFTNAHFKPFAAIGFEYNKVRATSGSPQLGSDVQFSIPQFGDFFHDMVLHVVINQPVITNTAADVSDQPLMRWCAYPGERLTKKVQFEVNGNPLDEYKHDAVNFHRMYRVQPNKQAGWNRCVGHESDNHGYVDQPNWVGSGVAPSAITHRSKVDTCSGLQTPSAQKTTAAEFFVPLLFWCNKDPRLAVPSVAIPYGQRFINVSLASKEELVGLVPRGASTWASPGGTLGDASIAKIELYINNIFVNPEVHNIFIKRIGFTLIRVHRQQVFTTSSDNEELLLQQLKWPIEALFVGMRMKAYSDTSTLSQHMDKWHTFSQVNQTSRSNAGWQTKKLVQTSSGLVAVVNSTLNLASPASSALTLTGGAATDFTTQVRPGDVVVFNNGINTVSLTVSTVTALVVTFEDRVSDASGVLGVVNIAATVGNTALWYSAFKPTNGSQTSTIDEPVKTIDRLTIRAHGIPIYDEFPSDFYSAYIPYHYGGPNIRTPVDVGAHMITFCLYPGTYQPSGHINVSRAREFYLKYDSSVISPGNEGNLVIVASAINFLLISDGSAVLRYST